MRYFSTFSGIGGFELGIASARVERMAQTGVHEPPIECVGYSEIDKYAVQVYQKHFSHTNYGDIKKITASTIPDIDLLVGGFPCQSFSIAGKRGGFDDTRGTLFFDLARILQAKQPRLFLFENVKGLLSHDNGRTFATIIATLDDLGYDLQWQVLNSKNHGVPQNRERVFIVGHLRGTPRPQVFPIGTDGGVPAPEAKSVAGPTQAEVSHTLRGSSVKADQVFILHNIYGGFGETKARVFDDVSPTIRTSKGGGHIPSVLKGSTIRRLTPTECERLQGFPDGWTADGTDGPMSDTQRYKMCGNAVTVNVIRDVVVRMIDRVQ